MPYQKKDEKDMLGIISRLGIKIEANDDYKPEPQKDIRRAVKREVPEKTVFPRNHRLQRYTTNSYDYPDDLAEQDDQDNDHGLKMTTSLMVKTHVKVVHKKIRDHICDHCGGGYSMAGGLREHIKVVHLNIREYRCDECGYETTARSNLKIA